jgi:hypothetical protein
MFLNQKFLGLNKHVMLNIRLKFLYCIELYYKNHSLQLYLTGRAR